MARSQLPAPSPEPGMRGFGGAAPGVRGLGSCAVGDASPMASAMCGAAGRVRGAWQ